MNDSDKPDTPETPDTPTAQPNPREEAMNAIARQNDERIAKELGLKIEDIASAETDPDVDPSDAAADAERKRLESEAAAAERQAQLDQQLAPEKTADKPSKPEARVLEDFDNVMVKTKVDGQEVMRPLAELVRIGQKEAAATQRLAQAAQMRAEAEQMLAKARQTPQDTKSDTKTPTPPAGDPVGKEFLDAMYSGEEDKALAAINKLFGQGRSESTTPDANAIARQVKQQIATDLALESFGSQYPEIVADPYLADVADKFLAAELEQGTPFSKALAKAGDTTRDWLKQKTGNAAAPTTTPTSRDEKRERKQAIDVIPSINATSTTSREPRLQSPSEVIEEMRKERGFVY